MSTAATKRLNSSPDQSVKTPVVAATTANITLTGAQTIDSVAVVAGDRVLVRLQTDSTENGVYDANTGAWTRATDWNQEADVIDGQLVFDANDAVMYSAVFTGDYDPGTTSLTFVQYVANYYLGPFASAPTLDNDGNALVAGQTYFNTASDAMYVRTSVATWIVTSTTPNAVDVVLADAGAKYAAADVEAAFAELASTAANEGADIIGVEDFLANFTGDSVEEVLAEIVANIDTYLGATAFAVTLLADANAAARIASLGITALAAELNYNDITLLGTTQASKTVTTDANGDIAHVGTQLHAAGEGCVFNGDSLAAANTLDDYEEGTWTPKLQDSSFSDGEGQTYNSQVGNYTKIGDTVFFSGTIGISSIGTLSGASHFVGLPFAAEAGDTPPVTFGTAASMAIGAGEVVCGRVNASTAYILLHLWDATTGSTALQISEISAGATLEFSGHYRV